MRSGSVIVLALFFVVPTVNAQQVSPGEELLAPDGTLIPDFERSMAKRDVDTFDEPVTARRVRPLEPQDPLNQTYAASSSTTIDERDNERLNNDLPDPLNEAPRNFRDDKFQKIQDRLVQPAEDGNWLSRDDTAFDPLGIRTGGFVFYPEIYSRLISTNNIFAAQNDEKSDVALEVTPTFRLRSDWNTHELEFFLTGTQKRWRTFTSENTSVYEARIRGRVDMTARTSLEAGARYEQDVEGRGSSELTDAAIGPAKTHETEVFGQINHRFNRLGFRLRGQLVRHLYDDVGLKSGGVQDNHLRAYDEQTLSLRTNYEFSPRLSVFADTQIGQHVFDNKLDADGLRQGSDSWLAAVGTRVDFTSNLSFLGRVGYARATPDEHSLVDLEGVVYDANLIWSPFRFTTLTLKGQTELEETTQSGSPGSINRSVSAELVNGWTHRLKSTLSAEYEVKDFAGIEGEDTELTFGLVAEYLFNRSWVLDAGIEHTRNKGSNSSREDEVHLGVKWRR